ALGTRPGPSVLPAQGTGMHGLAPRGTFLRRGSPPPDAAILAREVRQVTPGERRNSVDVDVLDLCVQAGSPCGRERGVERRSRRRNRLAGTHRDDRVAAPGGQRELQRELAVRAAATNIVGAARDQLALVEVDPDRLVALALDPGPHDIL